MKQKFIPETAWCISCRTMRNPQRETWWRSKDSDSGCAGSWWEYQLVKNASPAGDEEDITTLVQLQTQQDH